MGFYIYQEGFGKPRFPAWNPQAEFISAEENRTFRGLPLERICLFFCLSNLKACFQVKHFSASKFRSRLL